MSDYGSTESGLYQPDYEKDPDEVSDFSFNWKAELGGDLIVSSQFLLPDGMTSVSTSNTTTSATIFVSGGTAGTVCRITNRVTTAGGRTWDRTIGVLIQER